MLYNVYTHHIVQKHFCDIGSFIYYNYFTPSSRLSSAAIFVRSFVLRLRAGAVLPHGHMSQVGDSVTRPSSPSASYGPTRSTRIRIAERSCNGICRCSSVSSTAAQQRHAVWVPTAGNTRREASDAGILSVWVGVWGVQGASVLPQ